MVKIIYQILQKLKISDVHVAILVASPCNFFVYGKLGDKAGIVLHIVHV